MPELTGEYVCEDTNKFVLSDLHGCEVEVSFFSFLVIFVQLYFRSEAVPFRTVNSSGHVSTSFLWFAFRSCTFNILYW